jgi:AcrR family transcriptional regulator
MGKVDINKKQKKNALLQTAFDLFRDKGFAKTTISDIVSDAGLAKGTFYLYFKDKYDLRDKLIAHKAGQLFADAHHALLDQKFNSFEDQIIAVADYIIGRLNDDHGLLTFISKNLSWGVYNKAVLNIYDKTGNDTNNELTLHDLFINGIKENNIKLSNPDVTLFMIIELVGSTCFNSILYKEPLPIEEYKPYLYKTIRNLIKSEE